MVLNEIMPHVRVDEQYCHIINSVTISRLTVDDQICQLFITNMVARGSIREIDIWAKQLHQNFNSRIFFPTKGTDGQPLREGK